MKFLGNVLATIVGLFVFFMILFFGIVLVSVVFGGDGDHVKVKADSVIELDLKEVTQDYGGQFKFTDFDYFETKHDGVSDVLNAIEAAKTDDKIKGISILNNESRIGLAQSKAIRRKLEEFKKSGKFVVAYANAFSQKEYYLNSVADTVYLNPVGELDFKGIAAEILFFKDFEDKSGVKMEVIRHGKYKSAVEPFLENEMSSANREQMSALLNSIWSSVVTDISKSRDIPVDSLNAIANSLGARTPELAKQKRLIDRIAYEDEYHNGIRKALKVDKAEEYHKISILDYAENVARTNLGYGKKDKIAIIYAQGEIQSGEGDVTYIGEGSMRRSLEEARNDDKVKAVVLRVDSPGGSALTSELIWREIELTKKVKPVVVSMGNLAASGGYYISCNANTIFAESSTITGSIGVFGALPNFHPLATKLGINAEQVRTHQNASGYSVFEPIDNKFKEVVTESIETIYTTFLKRVADGRKMTVAQVDSIAQGRVWTGADALKLGLVDKIGGMDAAIKHAAKLAKVKEYRTEDYPEYEKTFEDLLRSLGGISMFQSKEALIKEEIGEENYQVLDRIRKVNERRGVQAVMPFELNIQ
ncbi:sppA protein [Flavobacterium limnosediminis JC2902]|uniref:SppA protein n=1 Tax=Flavobacterium limnosediminis JC2902 TaxID=1341181 RepID=V6SRY9_9FLAO|nr:signal peptide peptidase SppA [Flavobacterium limnosediminis]ESU29473.1 sppA protein [Flavobacterium limnosediminis JC2902]